jgi:GTP cyclohydrolase II
MRIWHWAMPPMTGITASNNPAKISDLEQKGIKIEERIPLLPTIYDDNYDYLLTKAQRMNHLLNLDMLLHG